MALSYLDLQFYLKIALFEIRSHHFRIKIKFIIYYNFPNFMK